MRHRQSNSVVLIGVCLAIILHAGFLPASFSLAKPHTSHQVETWTARGHLTPSFPAVAARPSLRQSRSITPAKQKSADAFIVSPSFSLHMPGCSVGVDIEASAAPGNQETPNTSNRSPPNC